MRNKGWVTEGPSYVCLKPQDLNLGLTVQQVGLISADRCNQYYLSGK